MMDIKARMRNPYFWTGLIGIILTAMGVDGAMLTSWDAVYTSLKDLLSNPYMLFSVFMAVLGVFVNPSTSGLKDLKKE